MAISRKLLSIIGRRYPAVYDLIPRGPLSRFSAIALNPQPLPPYALGAAIATEFVQTSWLTDRFGFDVERSLDDLDNWCPIGSPRFKLPPWFLPIPEPDPHPDWLTEFHLGFAAQLAVMSAELEGTRLSEVVNKAIERSVGAIESSLG
jgi:hypothetical protein